eukprot:1160422-Pelagomonas_calceolata.AAC.6
MAALLPCLVCNTWVKVASLTCFTCVYITLTEAEGRPRERERGRVNGMPAEQACARGGGPAKERRQPLLSAPTRYHL